MQDILNLSLTLTALATALVGGVFLTFSDFVMRSLSAATPEAGMEAMQLINRKVYQSVFMVLLLGLVPVVIALALAEGSRWTIAGGVIYLAGVMGVTMLGNVPMNKRLDLLRRDPAGLAYWRDYAHRWTRWNHVRSVASILAAASFLIAAGLF